MSIREKIYAQWLYANGLSGKYKIKEKKNILYWLEKQEDGSYVETFSCMEDYVMIRVTQMTFDICNEPLLFNA